MSGQCIVNGCLGNAEFMRKFLHQLQTNFWIYFENEKHYELIHCEDVNPYIFFQLLASKKNQLKKTIMSQEIPTVTNYQHGKIKSL